MAHRFLPDPLIFAILLTIATFALAFALTPQLPEALVMMWDSGFWNLLAFAMQMVLILVTGHALAIAGLGVRDIMGYCVTTLLFPGVVFVAGMYLF
ncbi:MAG TPA: TIGR00366 family protein [Paraburkholderia sp.]|nr:TIGR00366 family protein [Paraburkholderia sp.]